VREGLPHTSERNELSSSGSLTCATSKNLNCHLVGVSIAIPRAAVMHPQRLPESRPCCYRPIARPVTRRGQELSWA
jgi:hypothetical protein